MSAPHTSDCNSLPAGKTSSFIERIDSDRTDESPFGSTLTTPVDEDVELFPGIEQLLLTKGLDSDGGGAVYLGSQEAALEAHGLLKATQDEVKPSIGGTLKAALTPSPSLDQLNINFNPNTQTESNNERVSRPRAGSIYSQPNRPLNIPGETPDAELEEYPFFEPIPSAPAVKSPLASYGTDVGSLATDADEKPLSPVVIQTSTENSAQTAQELFALLPFAHKAPSFSDIALAGDFLSSSFSRLSPRNLVPTLLRVVFFLPWCFLAGGALLLFPGYLEILIFGPGFTASPRGIHRFAFFADLGSELVSIFVIVLAVFWYAVPTVGLLVIGGVTAQAIYAWQGFELDRSVPLGEDDRQTVYLVWKQYSFVNALRGLTSTHQGFYATGADNDENAEDEEGL